LGVIIGTPIGGIKGAIYGAIVILILWAIKEKAGFD
jgi:hypothetical protein